MKQNVLKPKTAKHKQFRTIWEMSGAYVLTKLKSSLQMAMPSGPTPMANRWPFASRAQCHSTP